jgi:hypothetical protein
MSLLAVCAAVPCMPCSADAATAAECVVHRSCPASQPAGVWWAGRVWVGEGVAWGGGE